MNPLTAAALAGLLLTVAPRVWAENAPVPSAALGTPSWEQAHPRQAEVNQRVAEQVRRINAQVASGHISLTKAAKLRWQEARILLQEKILAAHQGGHITPQQQAALNQQQDRLSAQIGG